MKILFLLARANLINYVSMRERSEWISRSEHCLSNCLTIIWTSLTTSRSGTTKSGPDAIVFISIGIQRMKRNWRHLADLRCTRIWRGILSYANTFSKATMRICPQWTLPKRTPSVASSVIGDHWNETANKSKHQTGFARRWYPALRFQTSPTIRCFWNSQKTVIRHIRKIAKS